MSPFGGVPARPDAEGPGQPGRLRLPGRGEFAFPVVGESRYTKAFEAICGPPTWDGEDRVVEATLVLEDSNPHDPQAVRVDVEGRTVGYLSRDDARLYRGWLRRNRYLAREAVCAARIRGGWNRGGGDRGHYGLQLDLVLTDAPPP